jgi:hypothetical protein
LVPASVGKELNSALSPFVTTVALVYGALLGFTVVVAWEQFSSAEVNVANVFWMPNRGSRGCCGAG